MTTSLRSAALIGLFPVFAARGDVLCGYAVAREERRPTWSEGDCFDEKLGKQLLTLASTEIGI
jgi:hypothetical protein